LRQEGEYRKWQEEGSVVERGRGEAEACEEEEGRRRKGRKGTAGR